MQTWIENRFSIFRQCRSPTPAQPHNPSFQKDMTRPCVLTYLAPRSETDTQAEVLQSSTCLAMDVRKCYNTSSASRRTTAPKTPYILLFLTPPPLLLLSTKKSCTLGPSLTYCNLMTILPRNINEESVHHAPHNPILIQNHASRGLTGSKTG